MDTDATRAVVDRHLDAWRRGDIAALLADYADDAQMLNVAIGVVAGKTALGAMFTQVFADLFRPGDTALTVDAIVADGDNALIHYTAVTSAVRTSGAYDAFTLRDGKIVTQFSGGEILGLASENSAAS